MVFVKLAFILLFCFIKANSIEINYGDEYATQISAVLKHLNSKPNKVYDYKNGVIVNTQQKADIVELSVNVDVSCIRYPEVPCTEQQLTCTGFLSKDEDKYDYKVLSDILCKPKAENSVETFTEPTRGFAPIQRSANIELSNEAVSSEQNVDFIAIKPETVPCLGCPFDLNTDADGVSVLVNTALSHVESEKNQKHIALKVIRLQEQVVSGVKYILLLEIAPTTCQKDVDYSSNCPVDTSAGTSVCEVIFLQQPWISSTKSIIKNNCTFSQEYAINERQRHQTNYMIDNINSKSYNPFNVDPIDASSTEKQNEAMDEKRLADLESQILFVEPQLTNTIKANTEEGNAVHQERVNNPNNNPIFTSHKIEDSIRSYDSYKPTYTFVVNQEQPNRIFSDVTTDQLIDKNAAAILETDQPNYSLGKDVLDENSFLSYNTANVKSPEETTEILSTVNGLYEIVPKNLQNDPEIIHSFQLSEDPRKDGENFRKEIFFDNFNTFRRDKVNSNTLATQTNLFSESSSLNKKRQVNNFSSEDDNSQSKSQLNSSFSESKSDESSENSSEIRIKRGSDRDQSASSDSSSQSQESKSISSEENKKLKTESTNDYRVKRSKKDDDSSSSSSSSENKSEDKKKKVLSNEDSSSSSSNSKSKLGAKDKTKDDSKNSSSSSDNKNADVESNKVKRSIGQLEKITQDEKILVRDLADFAASSLDDIDDDNHKRVILQILGAKKLRLDGIYYQIILRLGISHCSENEENENCREKLFTDLTKICKVQVHVEDDLSNPNVVKSQCQNIKKDEHDRNRTNYSRYRRNVLVGGQSDISLDDSRITTFTKDTLTELDSKSDFPNRHKIISIQSATVQIVAGAKYRIKAELSLSDCLKNDSKLLENCNILEGATVRLCDIVVWDQPWLKKRQTTVKCNDSDKEYSFENTPNRDKREIGSNYRLGGIEEETPDNKQANEYLKDILNRLDRESGHNNKLKIQEILSVRKQVVAGTLWRIKAKVTLSECAKSELTDPQNCETLEGSEIRTCNFKIWDRPWLPNGREVETTCENESKSYNFRLKRSIVGSNYIIPSSLDVKNEPNPKILEYLTSGLSYLDLQSIHKNKYIVKNINQVSKQTVAGQLWHITAEIVLSDCAKDYYTQYCEELENSESKICNFRIWDQPWILGGLQINITCENDSNFYSFTPNRSSLNHNIHQDVDLANFKDFIVKYNKSYSHNVEFNYRLKVFKDNLNTINLLNKYEQGTGKYGITRFADLTSHEFSKSHGLRMDLHNENDVPFMDAVIPNIKLPTEFDWRKKRAVTEVKNQGSCGSCWAFSTTGNIEGQYALKYGKLLEFSEQELVDCDKLDEGCDGGLMDNAYRSIEQLGGLETETDYPYDAEDEKCHLNKTKIEVQISGAVNISQNEDDMAKWLVQNGPISIAINANAMQFYVGGVSHPWKLLCNPKNLDHGVLIVGFGIHKYPLFNKTLPYWTIKNSWGPSWGEQGYYRVYRGDGTCGLNQTPSSAIVA